MKTLFLIFALLAGSLSLYADQTIVTATVTATNAAGTTNGMNITVNGTTRIFTNNVTAASVQILTNNTLQGTASNLFNAYAATREANTDIGTLSTNAMFLKSFPGKPMVVTVSAGWATVSFSTNTLGAVTLVRVPTSLAGNIERTNVESGLVDYLNDNKMTNSFNTNAPALVNFVPINQYASANANGIISSNQSALLLPSSETTDGIMTSNQYVQLAGAFPATNNAVIIQYTNGFLIKDANGTTRVIIGSVLANNLSLCDANGYARFSADGNSTTIKNQTGAALFLCDTVKTVLYDANAQQQLQIYTTNMNFVQTNITAPSQQLFAGVGSVLTYDLANGVYTVQTNGVATNLTSVFTTLIGTNTIDGSVAYLRKNNTSLANGNNAAVNVSTNLYVKLSGPSAAFTINGIAGGSNGRAIILQNSTTFVMTIANDSGVDPTAANRIFTGTSGDITVTNNPGFVELIYDSSTSRWGVRSRSN